MSQPHSALLACRPHACARGVVHTLAAGMRMWLPLRPLQRGYGGSPVSPLRGARCCSSGIYTPAAVRPVGLREIGCCNINAGVFHNQKQRPLTVAPPSQLARGQAFSSGACTFSTGIRQAHCGGDGGGSNPRDVRRRGNGVELTVECTAVTIERH